MRKETKNGGKPPKKVGVAHCRTKKGKPGLQQWARSLRRRGWTLDAIAAELGMHRHTVRHYLSRRIAWPKRRAKAAPAGTTACVKGADSPGCAAPGEDETS